MYFAGPHNPDVVERALTPSQALQAVSVPPLNQSPSASRGRPNLGKPEAQSLKPEPSTHHFDAPDHLR